MSTTSTPRKKVSTKTYDRLVQLANGVVDENRDHAKKARTQKNEPYCIVCQRSWPCAIARTEKFLKEIGER